METIWKIPAGVFREPAQAEVTENCLTSEIDPHTGHPLPFASQQALEVRPTRYPETPSARNWAASVHMTLPVQFWLLHES